MDPHAQRACARLINTACSRCTPLWKGVQGLHAIPSTLHAMCTPKIGVNMASRRARQACRACTPVSRACKACTPSRQACRLCTPVGSRYRGTLIRIPKYPYKDTKVPLQGYRGTLIRIPKYPYKGTLIRVPKYRYKGTLRTLIRVPVPL
ncbi:hypothetical protein PCANC_25456 [Puccinia coronata f. sp. avenae]|uniref:Uncharacterized protein n=1 Tax=Puccinia coronata f. sp. avenae TaxID=200324 RepID=A0A2N5TXW8_9BASI|nr:hypothetical protein PCANC_25456 [Puccinia coronata f. sp. avenae]